MFNTFEDLLQKIAISWSDNYRTLGSFGTSEGIGDTKGRYFQLDATHR